MEYDVIIIGAGPAGCSAAIYASRSDLKVLILSKELGGRILDATDIENYPGIKTIKGFELGSKLIEHASEFGAEIKQETLAKISNNGEKIEVGTQEGNKYSAKYLVLASGMKRKKLNVPGEEKLAGKGVSYCATCDGFFFKNKTAAVAGGGNAALMAAIELAQHASEVYMIVKEKKLMAEPIWIDRVEKNPKIKLVFEKSIKEIIGEEKVEEILLDDGSKISVEGVFVEVGSEPDKEMISEAKVDVDEQDYVIVDAAQRTSVKNIFAAGDLTTNSNKLRQVVTAVGEGAVAAAAIFKEFQEITFKKF